MPRSLRGDSSTWFGAVIGMFMALDFVVFLMFLLSLGCGPDCLAENQWLGGLTLELLLFWSIPLGFFLVFEGVSWERGTSSND